MWRRMWGTGSAEGFSVVELVTSSAILLTVLVSTMGVVGFASNTSGTATQRDRALNVASTVIERARNLPFDDIGVRHAAGGYGEPPGQILTPDAVTYPGFTVATEITWARSAGKAAYKQIRVTVVWSAPSAGAVSLETAIYGATELVNVGDLKVTVIDRDSGQPILGALVSVDPDGAAVLRLANALSDGVVLFGRIDQGPALVTVSALGYVFDNTLTTAVPINRDLTSEITVYGHRSSSLSVSVVDAAGPVAGATVSLMDSRGTVMTAVTDAAGIAPTFVDLFPGAFSLGASQGGRSAQQSSVAVARGGQELAVVVTLPTPVPAGQLRVTTRDATTLQPVSGVTLTLIDSLGVAVGGSPTATVSGQAVWGSLAPGTYSLAAAKGGYTTISGRAITIVSGAPSDCGIDLVPVAAQTGTIKVLVTDSSARPIRNLKVCIRYPDSREFDKKTASDGVVTWTSLPVGSYTVWVDGHAGLAQPASPGSPFTLLTFIHTQ
ncbi:MAG TPA: hypothetical protein VIK83_00690 [Coriobacteriia bacterium]